MDRRDFLLKSSATLITAGAGTLLLQSCDKEEEIAPAEDLMREHGLLNRIMLIYDHCQWKLSKEEEIRMGVVTESATIIRNFIEDYHEKLEEDFLFPRFEKANRLTDLVAVLRMQHTAGRSLTSRIMQLSSQKLTVNARQDELISALQLFNRMYRPHEAREDTVLFPALRSIISKHEYDSLGEDFEKREHELFGKEGFEGMVDKVATLEKELGIYELGNFTPVIKS